MRDPIYKTRPIEPNPARLGGKVVYEDIFLSEAFSNCYLIKTSEGLIQINAGMAIEAPVIKKNFDTFSADQVAYLILTQGHVDHVGGVQFFRDHNPKMKVIAGSSNAEHQNYENRLSQFRANRSAFAFTEKFLEIFKYYEENNITDFPAQDAPTPDILIEDTFSFTLGKKKFEVYSLPGAETNDSVIVWMPEEEICFTGNIFGCPFGHFPNLFTIRGDRYRDPLVVLEAVEFVKSLEPKIIMYGHHDPVIGKQLIADELSALGGAINFVHEKVVSGMNAGSTLPELMESINLPAEIEVGEGYGKVSWSVKAIWEYYAGWFHHQSTTELYNIPRNAISDDLVRMIGTEAMEVKAKDNFTEGKYQEALHFLDILRESGKLSAAGRSLYADILQLLLKEADNFWLESWLKEEINKLKR
ncbi:MAG: alkyl sulfatase dimerization domain-containing protein [Gammaproteobacteria bacterium]|jgi:alkyl sulfatase BDS1-like metallo-beta-lactamase superfamily hydrolase|tara:strand:+ start:2539 stop:3783 length:1245 start_codon:yes stop_codon:yes gene_type:complete